MSDSGLKAIVDENYALRAENTELRNALGRQTVMLDELLEKNNLKNLVQRVTVSDYPTENIGLTKREVERRLLERVVSDLVYPHRYITTTSGSGRGEIGLTFYFLRMP